MLRNVIPLAIILALAAGCASPQWTTHKDPSGFTVEIPRTWRVTRDAASGRAEVSGPQERLIVWPLFARQGLDVRAATSLLGRVGDLVLPGAAWQPARMVGAAALRSDGSAGDRAAVASLTLIPSAKGTLCYVYAAAAPRASYRQTAETFARILGSFRLTGAPTAEPAKPAMAYVLFKDPREGAFQVELPQGWNTEGGLFRFASVDTRMAIRAESPDGIRVMSGDAELPAFTEPTQMLAFSGFPEGSWYSPGYGVRHLVRRYVAGVHFARDYVLERAARGCDGVQITDERDRPDASSALRRLYGNLGAGVVQFSFDAGEVSYRCTQQGRPMTGNLFALTIHTSTQGMPGGIWRAEYLIGYLAPQGRETVAKSVIDHALQTFQMSPQWSSMQSNITANTSRIVSRTNTEISRIISDTYSARQETMDEISRRRSNATLGVVDVVDPVTGEATKVDSSSNYYWVDQRGTIVGTQTDTHPSIDFRQLIQLP